ncbi:DUF2786 domain-containing protein [Ornithinimicrobium sp. F0845]|uniref:DUF2786 domain-containing protein n=1 Tax=Ornithinimicrobium sp. F0845 TaxID=2926412 RepID=UPI001FF24FCE|nr:DUF2786 domain-containing protein [Ornithinimicrobium sp. F0845]MCK0111609.1 DUF2786 domain-containing protein [Ornithinimicrobium sp. F0845]
MSSATAGAHRAGDGVHRAGDLGALGGLIERVWARGWEPMDLHRAVRDHGPLALDLLGDVMAADLARYSAVTVDDRWHAQLEEIGASVWWRRDEDPVTARAARAKGGWPAVAKAAAALEVTLQVLPAIEQLSPRPGQATARSTPGPEVDQRLLSKVRMMLAKAESTPYAAEAETFTAAAQKLMTRHSIDRALLDREGGGSDGPAAIRVGIDRPYESARFHLVAAIAEANRCKAVWQKGLGSSTVVGFPTDLRAVELLFTSLMVQATAAMTAEGSRQHWTGQSRTRSFRNSFLTAFAVRIGERLHTAAQEAQDETGCESQDETGEESPRKTAHAGHLDAGATRDGDARTRQQLDRTALVRVLAERDHAVEEAVAERFPRLQKSRSRASFDAEGWVSGTSAADRADLGAPGRIERPGA